MAAAPVVSSSRTSASWPAVPRASTKPPAYSASSPAISGSSSPPTPRSPVVAKAKEGSLQAISAVERSLREAIAKPGVDIHNITGAMLARLVGVSGKSIWDWQKRGLRQNGQGAYDLAVFLPWYRDHLLSQVCVGKNSDTDPLRTQKAREKAIQVAELEGRLWPREQVMAGLAARARVLAETLSATKASELGQRLGGQPEPEIARIIEAFFIEAKRAACQLDEELRLPPAARKLWTDLMTMLSKTEGDE